MTLFIEQLLNGFQFGITLFLISSGLTLIFGIMGIINLAHGSIYMTGAYAGAWAAQHTGSFLLAFPAALLAAGIVGVAIETAVIRRLYQRDYLDQVLATFALVLIFNQTISMLFGRQPLFVSVPAFLDHSIKILPGLVYPAYRLAVIGTGLLVAFGLYILVNHTRIGMLVRAGAADREMVRALGVDIRMLYTLVFAFGALLAGLAGFFAGPINSVQPGMGEQILIVAFVVVVVGGAGSVKGALFAGLLIGVFDTLLRAYLPGFLRDIMAGADADALGSGVSSMGIYFLMTAVLLIRPKGLFPL